MAWTTPKTWTATALTSSDLNTYMRDNQNYLKSRADTAADQYIRTASDYTTTVTSYQDVDLTNMHLSVTTTGADVRVTFTALAELSAAGVEMTMAVELDSSGVDKEMTQTRATASTYKVNPSFSYIFTGLSAGVHTFTLRWKVSSGTGTLTAGDTLFDVREDVGAL